MMIIIIIAFILLITMYFQSKDNITIVAVIISFTLGILGDVLNNDYNLHLPGLGSILSIVTMGAFIIKIKKNK